MNPFGGTPICPRCTRAVYAAEQVMGPGKKYYHKPCLNCTTCRKRLDSFSLREHDQEPYCNSCHMKQFGPRDLRSANISPTNSPSRPAAPISPPATPEVKARNVASTTRDRPTPSGAAEENADTTLEHSIAEENEEQAQDGEDEKPAVGTPPSNGMARRTPPSDTPSDSQNSSPSKSPNAFFRSARFGGSPPITSTATGGRIIQPLNQTATGGVYGAKRFGELGGTPVCPKCNKAVYFAEQVNAIGKKWHKLCLRCSECNSSLDSGRLSEKDGNPLCRTCYSKLHGPAGIARV